MGKSAILSAWLARREAAGAVVPHHFVRRQVADWDQPEVIAASLAAQIEAAYPDLRDPEAKPERRLLELLGRASQRLGSSGRLVLMVDGLDETRAEAGDNPLPRFLPHVVPAGIRLLCATRPTYPHLSWIEARSPVRRLDLDDRRWAASNEAVVRGFWESLAPGYEPPLEAATLAIAIARADGNVLHAVMLHDAWRDLAASERRADRIPRGLKGLLGEIWDRSASAASVRAGLGLLCAAQEALSLEVLADLAGWSYDEREQFLCSARQLLLEEPASWSGIEAYRPRHDWIRELIAERLGAAALRAHHRTLARKLAIWPALMEATARRYTLRHALIHRAEAGDWADAWQLAADMGFMEAKCRELGAHEAEADVARVAERCRASGDPVVCRRYEDLAGALARESHWLRAAPEATAALVWNRLRRSEWSADDLDANLRVPAAVAFLRVRHWTARESPAVVRDLVGHAGPVEACAVTPDGRRVVSASSDRTLKIWDLESGRVLATLEGHHREVTGCAVTPDGRCMVSASEDGTLKVWDLESGRALATLEGHDRGVSGCAVTPDGRRVVSASWDGTLRIWDLETGRALATLEGHQRAVSGCAVTPDGRRVVSASWDRTLKVWDLETGRALATLEGHTGLVLACAVTADGRRVVSASWDKTLKVWDLESGDALATMEGHAGWVLACAVTPDARRLISGARDGTLKIWDLERGHALATLEGHHREVSGCAVTPDGRRLASASYDGMLKVWDLASDRMLAGLSGHAARVSGCAVTADGKRVISASYDGTLKIWDLESGHAVGTLEGHTGPVKGLAVTADGRRIVSAAADRRLRVWDLESRRALATLPGHTGGVTGCAVTVDGMRVISASWDKTLKVWDLESGRVLATLEGHAGEVNACAVTSDGRCVVSASEDGMLAVWDLERGHTHVLEGHAGEVNACAVTPDDRCVISASTDGSLRIWDLESGRTLATLEGHTGPVGSCAITVDGRRVISASEDRTLKVWDLVSHACLFTHRGDAAYTAVTATASVIVAGDDAGAVWFLEWPREPSPRPSRPRKARTSTVEPTSARERRRR
jgi:WD40 repeat protein